MNSNAAGSSKTLLLVLSLTFTSNGLASEGRGQKEDPYPSARAPFVTLVDKGHARVAIVAPSAPTAIETHAIDELVAYVRKMTGIELAVGVKARENLLPVYVGSAAERYLSHIDWNKLGDNGFVLKSGAEGVYIAGACDLGTLYGVYHLLEKHLGVRWFMPGEIGEVVPRSNTLVIGTFEETEIPSFRVRWIESGDWALRQKMNVSIEVGDRPVGINWRWGFHTHFKLIPPEEYFDEHPDWFALYGRKRRRPTPGRQGQQLCTSNAELIEEMATRIIKMFDRDPSLDILALAPQDGGGFCQCRACVALDE